MDNNYAELRQKEIELHKTASSLYDTFEKAELVLDGIKPPLDKTKPDHTTALADYNEKLAAADKAITEWVELRKQIIETAGLPRIWSCCICGNPIYDPNGLYICSGCLQRPAYEYIFESLKEDGYVIIRPIKSKYPIIFKRENAEITEDVEEAVVLKVAELREMDKQQRKKLFDLIIAGLD